LSLNTNLSKWLSNCEGSLLERKEKSQYKSDDDELRKCRQAKIEDDQIIKKRNKKQRWIGKWSNEEK